MVEKGSLIAPDVASALSALRAEMQAAGNVAAYIVPSEDPHMSEYPPDCCQRRMYISGFTGSAGTVVVTMDAALLWTDGRYYLQAEQQLSESWTLMRADNPGVPSPSQWLATTLPRGAKVAVDPYVHTINSARTLQTDLAATEQELTMTCNLVDKVWTDRPGWPQQPTRVHPPEWAGRTVSDKLLKLRQELASHQCDAILLNDLAEIAWLFNLRGSDVDCNPVFVAYALVDSEHATLFIHAEQVTEQVAAHLKEAEVDVEEYDAFRKTVEQRAAQGDCLWLDPAKTSFGIYSLVYHKGAESSAAKKRDENGIVRRRIVEEQSPIQIAKAIKNEQEQAGMLEAHLRDAVALCEHFSWFEEQMEAGKQITEVELDKHLTAQRAAQPGYIGPSFPTIAGCNGNGAIIHYRAEPDSCATIDKSCMLLVDSGGQYDCGTTDITRTFHFGQPTQHQKNCYTRVLQGHIALDTAVWPEGVTGHSLDTLARAALWRAGLDYRHGTGHGVGAALNVHEGPQGISFRPRQQPLIVGMIMSNEPGYYEDNKFGIRIENLAFIKDANTEFRFAGKGYMTMEPITFVPIETKLINVEILIQEEREWVNNYHQKVLAQVSPCLEGRERALAWLKKKTQPI